jgi:hypothetical protein
MGKTMAKYYVRFPTMKSFGEIANDSEAPQLLEIVSKAEEFSDVILVSRFFSFLISTPFDP